MESDNQQLIELTAASPMPGDISLRIDRYPDFFALLKLRGESVVFIAEEHQKIIGCICASRQQVYVHQKSAVLYYVGDFKVASSYRNKGIGLALTNKLEEYLLSVDADLICLNVAKGNKSPFTFFSNRPNVSDFESLGIFNIYQFTGKKISKQNISAMNIFSTALDQSILDYLNNTYKKYELGSIITSRQLEGCDTYIILDENKLAGVFCLTDTMQVKQNVVVNISFTLKYILKLVNLLQKVLGISKMPELHQPVKMLYIKYLAVDDNNSARIKDLINFARNVAYEKGYSFVSLGLHQKDPINHSLNGMIKFTFHSVGMILSLKNNKNLIDQVKEGIPFEDYSLV